MIPVETCSDGAGNVALTWGLFAKPEEAPTAEIVTSRTRYRSHRGRCAERRAGGAFSGESFARKKKGEL